MCTRRTRRHGRDFLAVGLAGERHRDRAGGRDEPPDTGLRRPTGGPGPQGGRPDGARGDGHRDRGGDLGTAADGVPDRRRRTPTGGRRRSRSRSPRARRWRSWAIPGSGSRSALNWCGPSTTGRTAPRRGCCFTYTVKAGDTAPDGIAIGDGTTTFELDSNDRSLGQVSPAYSAVDWHAVRRLRRWLCLKHKVKTGKYVRFPNTRLRDEYGLTRLSPRTKGLLHAKA